MTAVLRREGGGAGGPSPLDAGAGGYVERFARPGLTSHVSSAYTQRADAAERTSSRHIPNGSVEVRCVPGASPFVVGPLTSARTEELQPGSSLVGVRLRPGAAPALLGLPASEIVDQVIDLGALWGDGAERLMERVAGAGSDAAALTALEQAVEERLASASPRDTLVMAAVRDLMPWRSGDVGAVAARLSISESQLRRRTQAAVGIPPKVLQRTLRFQGFLALVQEAVARGESPRDEGIAALAAEVGFADQPHLNRECLRLAGCTPADFIAQTMRVCAYGHDHATSFRQLLSARRPAAA
jgi:AraC-like DNA-binding protein